MRVTTAARGMRGRLRFPAGAPLPNAGWAGCCCQTLIIHLLNCSGSKQHRSELASAAPTNGFTAGPHRHCGFWMWFEGLTPRWELVCLE